MLECIQLCLDAAPLLGALEVRLLGLEGDPHDAEELFRRRWDVVDHW